MFLLLIKDAGTSDIWDDSALIKAYDEAVNVMQEKLVERGIDSCAMSSNNRTKKKKRKKGKHTAKKDTSENYSQWKVSDHCRAVYTEDGELYEAVILSIHSETDTCYIRYLGYGNEEEHFLSDLLLSEAVQSDSKEGRYVEIKDSDALTGSESGVEWERTRHHAQHTQPQRRAPGRGTHRRCSHDSGYSLGYPPTSVPFGGVPPPTSLPPFMTGTSMPFMPPPMIPPMSRNMFHTPDFLGTQSYATIPPPPPLDNLDLVANDKEALHSMLISWYMSGYHTGYYQGLKAGNTSKGKDKQRSGSRH